MHIRNVQLLPNRMVQFSAMYEDGGKRLRTLSVHHSWIAKKGYPFHEAKTEKLEMVKVLANQPYASFEGRTEIPEELRGTTP